MEVKFHVFLIMLLNGQQPYNVLTACAGKDVSVLAPL